MSIRIVLVDDRPTKKNLWEKLSRKTRAGVVAGVLLFSHGFVVGVGHEIWPKNPEKMTPAQVAKAFGIPHGYTIEPTKDGQMLIHTTQCEGCYRPGPTVVVKFPARKPDAHPYPEDFAPELISQIEKAENPQGVQIALARRP